MYLNRKTWIDDRRTELFAPSFGLTGSHPCFAEKRSVLWLSELPNYCKKGHKWLRIKEISSARQEKDGGRIKKQTPKYLSAGRRSDRLPVTPIAI